MSELNANALEMRNLSVSFGKGPNRIPALDAVTLVVEPGTVFGFIGPNGAGKTTAMHILLGFVSATSGEAFVFGEDVRKTIARERIGYLSERPSTYSFLTGLELLSFSGRMFGLQGKHLKKRIDSVLDQVDLKDGAHRRIASYSRGMLQRICLADALINDPDLVILDEPTSGMDPVGRTKIRQIVERLRDESKTVFFSSHELSEVETVCDQVAILVKGRIVKQGKITDIGTEGESLERYFLRTIGASNGT
jgi:ABC-2 type transport system ATP-binding protein